MLTLKIAFRNIFRQRRRSLLTGMTMAMGFILVSLSLGLQYGMYDNIIDMFTRDHTGHIQIHRTGYLEHPSLYDTLNNIKELGRDIDKEPEVVSWTPRVLTSVLAFKGKKTTGARLIGIDPVKEAATTRIARKISQGKYLDAKPSKEAMIGEGLAKVLHITLGDELVLISQGADGSIANDIFTVRGIVGSGTDSYEKNNCYLHIDTARDFLTLGNKAHEIAIILKDIDESRAVAASISKRIDNKQIETLPWEKVEASFYRAMEADVQGAHISLGIIMLIVAIGILNTVLMTILERTREFGVMRAIGTRPGRLIVLIVLETGMLSIIAAVIGLGVAWPVNYWFSVHGISLSEPIQYGGITMDTMQSMVAPWIFVVPAVLTITTALLVSIIPALRAAKITPVDALRDN